MARPLFAGSLIDLQHDEPVQTMRRSSVMTASSGSRICSAIEHAATPTEFERKGSAEASPRTIRPSSTGANAEASSDGDRSIPIHRAPSMAASGASPQATSSTGPCEGSCSTSHWYGVHWLLVDRSRTSAVMPGRR